MNERIQKVLATAGVASRRKVEDLIREGRVTVNGQKAVLGQKIGQSDRVSVDSRGISLAKSTEPMRVLAYKKRAGEIVTRDDPEGRRTVFRKLAKLESGRWIAIGRLDINTSGLLLFTNSGELAQRLMHPSYEIEREYAVRVLGEVTDQTLEQLQRGVDLEDGPAHFEKVWRSGQAPSEEETASANQWYQVIVKEGRHRLVRKLWEAQRCQVSRLMRVRFGIVDLPPRLKRGEWVELKEADIKMLLDWVGSPALEDDEPAEPASPRSTTRRSTNRRSTTPGSTPPRSTPPLPIPRRSTGTQNRHRPKSRAR